MTFAGGGPDCDSSHEEGIDGRRASAAIHSLDDEDNTSIGEGGPTAMVPPGSMMSAGSVLAEMAFLVASAFSLGMWVGGRAVAPGGGGTTGRR